MNHNFYPGPSTLHPSFEDAVRKAIETDILSFNHRSKEFHHLYQSCFELLKDKWDIPEDYELYFVSSATECWEIIAQSIIGKNESTHLFNGSFGEKSHKITNNITSKAKAIEFDIQESITPESELGITNICLNETSNGSHINPENLIQIHDKSELLCVDVTSFLGASNLDFTKGDVWYASVQKCLGLPSGMAVMIVSPKAIDIARHTNDRTHYNSILNLSDNFKKFETTHTPNTLDIFSLYYTQVYTQSLATIEQELKRRKDFLFSETSFKNLIEDKDHQSLTTMCISSNIASNLIEEAREKNIVFGKGYGQWKNSTFRIANFPSIKNESFEALVDFLGSYN